MLREMTSQQFDEWIAYYQLEPFGILAHDVEWAHWKAIFINSNMKKGKPRIKTEKLMMFREKEEDASAIFEKE